MSQVGQCCLDHTKNITRDGSSMVWHVCVCVCVCVCVWGGDALPALTSSGTYMFEYLSCLSLSHVCHHSSKCVIVCKAIMKISNMISDTLGTNDATDSDNVMSFNYTNSRYKISSQGN